MPVSAVTMEYLPDLFSSCDCVNEGLERGARRSLLVQRLVLFKPLHEEVAGPLIQVLFLQLSFEPPDLFL